MNSDTEAFESHSTIVLGRREGGIASVFALSDMGIERLQSERRFGESALDWCIDLSAIELGHVLLRRICGRVPSRRLAARFAVCFLMEQEDEGFDISVLEILEWLAVESDPHEWLVRRECPELDSNQRPSA
jgi:hypothetical protein